MKNRICLVLSLVMICAFGIGAANATGNNDSATVTSKAYVDEVVLGKQDALAAQQGEYAVLFPNADNDEDDGEVQPRAIVNGVSNYDDGNELVTAGGIKTALDSKQDTITGTSGNVVLYDNSLGAVGSKAVYAGNFSTQSTALVQANQVNTAIKAGLNALVTCAQHEDPQDNTSPCILYHINSVGDVF